MVSLQTPSSPRGRETSILELDDHDDSRKKRKWEDHQPPQADQLSQLLDKRSKQEISNKSIFEIELQLETPLPLEWQRCLDIQSGQIHFCNTRTNKRTSRDPRRSPEPPSSPHHGHMSLDLKLNLPCESQRRSLNHAKEEINCRHTPNSSMMGMSDLFMESGKGSKAIALGGLPRRPSWLACEGDRQEEMVATVCARCHMLVMLCKSSPACPNCRFMHPPDQSEPKWFKQRLSLFF